jgi:hypothetical protein
MQASYTQASIEAGYLQRESSTDDAINGGVETKEALHVTLYGGGYFYRGVRDKTKGEIHERDGGMRRSGSLIAWNNARE